ncbi:MAG: hypothetical protein KF709_00760 [Gemmatimonadaceae bacterium]|nr:hypothetical protein [Gemmatimonadaceae bacterium]
MRSRVLVSVVAIAWIGFMMPGIAMGQGVVRRVDNPPPIEEVSASLLKRLFDGITLSPEQQRRALAIIVEEHTAQRALKAGDPEIWNKRKRLNFVRDSTLRMLLTTPADRERFERQAAPLRPQGDLPRRNP